jgi:hypothetical protein
MGRKGKPGNERGKFWRHRPPPSEKCFGCSIGRKEEEMESGGLEGIGQNMRGDRWGEWKRPQNQIRLVVVMFLFFIQSSTHLEVKFGKV